MIIKIDVPEGYIVQVVPEEKSGRSVTPEWIEESREKFKGINVDREWAKAKAWCGVNKRQCTRQFFVKWLNRIDPDHYTEIARADLQKEANEIIARGWTDAIGWRASTPEDAERLKELRKEYKKA